MPAIYTCSTSSISEWTESWWRWNSDHTTSASPWESNASNLHNLHRNTNYVFVQYLLNIFQYVSKILKANKWQSKLPLSFWHFLFKWRRLWWNDAFSQETRLPHCFEFLREARDKHLYQCASNTCQGLTDTQAPDK